jgi:lysophospholipase L1-like esterase
VDRAYAQNVFVWEMILLPVETELVNNCALRITFSIGLSAIAFSMAGLHAADAKPPLPATPRKQPDADWEKKHAEFVETAKKGGIDLLFAGDSITHGWDTTGKQAFAKNFAAYKVANFGIGGDRTEHILYRLQNGELDGITPKLIVLLIGTNNNASGHKPEDTAQGIHAILETIKSKSPQTKVLLLGILPRGDDDVKRKANDKTNALIAAFDDGGKTVSYLDIAAKFTAPDGKLSEPDFQEDHLHLSAKGYDDFAAAIVSAIKQKL